MQHPPRREPEIDFEQILNRVRSVFAGMSGRSGSGRSGSGRLVSLAVFGILGLSFIIWMASGTYQVRPGEQAVHRTFGECCRTTGQGLHWWWPAPIGTKNIESTEEIRSMQLGINTSGGVEVKVQEEAQMIAGDLNIVDVPLVVQYRIQDLESFLFKVSDPGESIPPGTRNIAEGRPEGRTLKDATEAALRLVVGESSIDDVLTGKREDVQTRTQTLLQEILDSYGTGILILSVRLQEVQPPAEVFDAFQEVNRARQDRDTAINKGEAYKFDQIPRAEGDAEKIIQGANAFKIERVNKAEGEAGRFLSILQEYRKSPDVTRQRLYLEAMEDVLPGISKFVVSPGAGGAIILNAGTNVVPVPSPTSLQPPAANPTPGEGG